MKVLEIGKGSFLVRHWGRWYRVQRGGSKWQRLKLKRRSVTAGVVFDLDAAIHSINQFHPRDLTKSQ